MLCKRDFLTTALLVLAPQILAYPPKNITEIQMNNPNLLANGFHKQQVVAALTTSHQELILLPTEKCNFRCTYCYEDFELGKMSERTQHALELFIEKKISTLKSLRFSWFGGEPLAAKGVVLRLATFAKHLCEQNEVQCSGGLTTNGYVLDAKLARELILLKQNFFQITLDGWKEAHDELRKRADGKGTFDVIWRNLLSLKSLDLKFEVCVRVHVRRNNQENLEVLMREYAKHFFNDARFYLDFQHLRDMGGEGGKSVEGVTRAELSPIEIRLRKVVIEEVHRLRAAVTDIDSLSTDATAEAEFILAKAANAGESAGSERRSEQLAATPYICYAAKANSLLVRSNGRLGKCTVAFDDERNDIGFLSDDGRIVIDQDKLRPWLRGFETLNVDDTGCPLHDLPKLPSRYQALEDVRVRVVS